MFGRYTPDNYDKYHYLKAPVGFYFLLAILLRPYIVWVVSLANRNNATVLLESLYPNKYQFFAALGVGLGAVFVTLMLSLRREKAYAWLPKVWKHGRLFLWGSLIADISLMFYILKKSHFSFAPDMALILLGLFFAAWHLATSVHIKDFFNDWPEETLPGYEKPE